MSELSAAPSDLDTPAASDESPRRRSAHTEGSMSSTGLMVRADLYDEEYSEDEYEQMLSMYEGTMASIAEGEIVKSKVLRITENAVILDVGFKSEGSVALDEFKEPPAGRRRGRGLPRAPRGPGRRRRPVQEEGRLHAGLGEDPGGARGGRAGRGHPGQEDQGRRGREPDGRGRLPARQPDRAPPGAEHRRAPGPDLRVQDHQAQQAPAEHRRQPPRHPRARAGAQARAPDEGARRSARCGRASSRTSPTSGRSSTSAAWTACSTSPTCPTAACRTRPRWSPSAARSRSRSSTSTGSASASASA